MDNKKKSSSSTAESSPPNPKRSKKASNTETDSNEIPVDEVIHRDFSNKKKDIVCKKNIPLYINLSAKSSFQIETYSSFRFIRRIIGKVLISVMLNENKSFFV